jgi:hypothetical protein
MTTDTATSEWVTLPREIAERHPLYGIGGWMITVILRCASIPITVGPALVPLYAAASQIDHADPIYPYILAEIPIRAFLVVWAIANVFLIFSRNRFFPRSYIGYLLFLSAFIVFDAYANLFVAPQANGEPSKAFYDVTRIVGSVLGTGVWIVYAIVSRRVNVTFLGRVRSDDPVLRQSVAEVF